MMRSGRCASKYISAFLLQLCVYLSVLPLFIFALPPVTRLPIYNGTGLLALPNNAKTVKLSVIFIPKRNINI